MTWLNSPDKTPPPPRPPISRGNPFTAALCIIGTGLIVIGIFVVLAGNSADRTVAEALNMGFIGGAMAGFGVTVVLTGVLVAAIDWIVTNRR